MLIETLTWGMLDIKQEQVYHFAKGIPGFEEETKFALISDENPPFNYLQSLKTQSLSFLMIDPFIFYPGYEFLLPDSDKEELEIVDDVMVCCIVTVKDELEKATLNLLAPVVLNPVKCSGKQVVLHKSTYETRHPLWNIPSEDIKKGGE